MDVVKTTDPVTKKDSFSSPEGYDSKADDDIHKCGEAQPAVSNINTAGNTATFVVSPGAFSVDASGVTVSRGGAACTGVEKTSGNGYKATCTGSGAVTVNVTDTGYYTASASGGS